MAEPQPRVLVVDDERFFREAIADVLAEAGIDCDVAATGQQGLAAACSPEVGVVVLDVSLPDMSGIEVLRKLRAERPSVRVIVLSAHTDQELVLDALRLEASDYLAKPLHDEELVLAVRRALAGFDVESSWQRLRERLRRLQTHATALEGLCDSLEAGGEPDVAALAAAASAAVADVLEARRTSVMVLDPGANELRVVAATGADVDLEEMDPVALGEGVAGIALALGEAVIVDDVYSDRRFPDRTHRDSYESASLAVAPLRSREHLLGVLCATDRASGIPFGEDELSLLRILALPVARYLLRARRLPDRAAPEPAAPAREGGELDAEVAREVCEAVAFELEPGRVIAGVLRPIARRLGAPLVGLHLIDNPSGELRLEGEQDEEGCGERTALPRDRGLTGAVLQTGALVATDHPERDPRFDPEVDTAADGAARPLLCLPVRLRGKVIGVLRAFPEAGAAGAASAAEVLAAVVAAAVRNVLLYRSLLESIDEVAEARRGAAGPGGGPGGGTRT